jgi:hypothetical protein
MVEGACSQRILTLQVSKKIVGNGFQAMSQVRDEAAIDRDLLCVRFLALVGVSGYPASIVKRVRLSLYGLMQRLENVVFWSRPLVSDDLRFWIFDCFEWFDEHFAAPPKPILPTKEFFEAPKGNNVDTASLVLADVKKQMAYEGPVEIIPLDVLPAEYRIDYQALSAVSGTHQKTDDISVIRYDPELMNRPIQFINLLAHELMHARLDGLEDAVPGGEGAHELATDLGCIIAGYGVFQLQAADEAGWSGYMTQNSRAFSLAVFLKRRGLKPDSVSPFLSARCNKLLVKAFKEV